MKCKAFFQIICSLNPSSFNNLGYDKWSEMEQTERRKFLFLIIEKCEAADPDLRLTAARVLLYLVQGIPYSKMEDFIFYIQLLIFQFILIY